MATFLLLVIYFAFIGLGIPDSVLGSCWPSIQNEFQIPIFYNSILNIIITLCTMISSLLSPKIVKKIGTGWTTAISTFSTAVALLLYSFSNDFIFLVLLSLPLGFGAGAIDSGLNHYVATNYKASHMNFLHCFYGLGVFLSPLLMSFALKNTSWREGYRYVAIVQIFITILAFSSLPIWKKKNAEETEKPIISNGYRDVLKIKQMRVGCLVFLFSCALEFTCGNWATSFYVKIKGFSSSFGAFVLGTYYIGMALGRFTSGILTKKLSPFRIVFLGLCLVGVGIIIITLPLPHEIAILGLFLIGFGNGPVFPNLTHETPLLYGEEKARSIISLQMASCYVGCTLVPFIFGLIATNFLCIFPYYIMLFYVLTLLSFVTLLKMLKKSNNFGKTFD